MLATVQQWNERGFGFVEFADGTRAYIHNKESNGQHLTIGETITAVPRPDNRDDKRLQATEVRRGPFGEEATVIEWDEDAGVGSVVVDDTFSRASVHRETLERAGGGFLDLGERLRVVTETDEYDPTRSVVTEVKDHLGMGTVDVHQLLAQLPPPPMTHSLAPAAPTLAQSVMNQDFGFGSQGGGSSNQDVGQTPDSTFVPTGKPESGTVCDWFDNEGYGYLAMEDGRRVYIHRCNFMGGIHHGSLIPGQCMLVTSKQDKRNPGKWCVAKVMDLDGQDVTVEGGDQDGWDGGCDEWGNSSNSDGFESWGAGKKNIRHVSEAEWKWNPSTVAAKALLDCLRPKRGVVSDWNESEGFGFLMMGDGQRVYIHRSVFGGSGDLRMGQEMQVTTQPDVRNRGKCTVKEVLAIDGVIWCGAAGASGEDLQHGHNAKRQRMAQTNWG